MVELRQDRTVRLVRSWCSSLGVLSALALASAVAAQSPAPIPDSSQAQSTIVAAAQAGERIVRLPQALDVNAPSDALIHTWVENSQSFYRVALDGAQFSETRVADYRIKLRLANFDPLQQPELALQPKAPALENAIAEANSQTLNGERRLHIVQFVAPPSDEFTRPLLQLPDAVSLRAYLPEYAWVVEATPAAAEHIAAMPHVRWVGPFFNEYKLEPAIWADLGSTLGSTTTLDNPKSKIQSPKSIATRRYHVMLFERGPAAQQRVAERIAQLGGIVHARIAEGFRLEATLTGAQLLEVIALNDVHYIDRWAPAGVDMDLARQIGGAVPLLSGLGFTGQGVRGEVMDDGIRLTHQAFASPAPLVHGTAPGSSSHGTSTYGIVFGNGAGNAAGTGMLPNRQQGIFAIYTQLIGHGGSVSRYTHTSELVDPNGPYRAVFQSNSWGTGLLTNYTTVTAEMDDILFLHPIVHCQSQSNQGTQVSRSEAWAKNSIAVGGIVHNNTLTRTDDSWNGASHGPADDGRIKPDLAHFYENVLCPTSNNDSAYVSNFFGTSAATPIVCGHFGLLMQMWHQGVFAGFGGQSTVFDSRPAMATAKAMMINSAFRYNWLAGGSNATLTRPKQGWGMPDLARLYNDRNKTFIVNQTDPLTPFASRTYRMHVAPGEPQLRVTMVYTDPKGNPGAGVARINDLSLKVTAPNGTFYWGNNGLNLSNESFPGGNSNTIDTVENVFLTNPMAGVWTIQVFGDQIVEDARLSTPELDADFALVIAGVTPVSPCVADLNGDMQVGVPDLLMVISQWGACPPPSNPCPADIAPSGGDGTVGVPDLLAVIAAWGPCP